MAGVGNIYADEALWAARLHPLRSAASVGPAAATRLHRELRRILAEAIERRGSSVDDYTAPGGDGSMQERLVVYQRAGLPCPRCGQPIRRIVLGGRATHFCSYCQRLPAADRAAAARVLRTMEPARRGGDRGLDRGRRPRGEGRGGGGGGRGKAGVAASHRRGPRWVDLPPAADGTPPLGPRR